MARAEVEKLMNGQQAAVEKYRTEKNLARLCYRLMCCDTEYRMACGLPAKAYRVRDVLSLVCESGIAAQLQIEFHEIATTETVRAALDTIERTGYLRSELVNDSGAWARWSGRWGDRKCHVTHVYEYKAREYSLAK